MSGNRNEGVEKPLRPKQFSPLLTYIFSIYVAGLLIANVLANHMLVVGMWTTSAGILTFPFSYICASILAEIYGYKWARRAAWSALSLSALLAAMIFISTVLPQPAWYLETHNYSPPFITAMSNSWRIVVASLCAFTIGKFANDRMFSYLKTKRGSKGFVFRALASSILGHIFDGIVFSFIAFFGTMPIDQLLWMIPVGAMLKWIYEWLFLPVTLKAVKWVVKKEKEYAS